MGADDASGAAAPRPSAAAAGLAGLRVLVVEDEPLVALFAAAALRAAGCRVVGPAATAEAALRLVPAAADAAVLDLRLGRSGTSAPVAEALAAAGVPFLFATAHGAEALPAGLRDRPLLRKPYGPDELLAALAAAVGNPREPNGAAAGPAAAPAGRPAAR